MSVSPSSRILRAEHTDYDGTEWRVDIHDNTAPGTNTRETYLSAQGINFTTEGRNELYDWIHPMTCEFELMVKDSDIEDTLNAFAESGPQRYYAFVYKGNTRYFVGMIVNDTVEEEDAPYPYIFRIRAIDGLATLKDRIYDNNGTPYTGYAKISGIITRCLSFMPTSGFYDNASPPIGGFMLNTAVRWYENDMADTLTTDTLEQTRIKQELFDKREEYADDPDPMSAWEVLEKICLRYAARLFYAEGKYWLMQPDILVDGATFTAYSYLRGAQDSSTSSTQGGTIDVYDATNTSATAKPLANGLFTYYKAYKEIKLKSLVGNPNLNFDGVKWSGDGIYTNSVLSNENISATDIVIEDVDTSAADMRIKFSARATLKVYDLGLTDGDIYADQNFVQSCWGQMTIKFEVGGKESHRPVLGTYTNIRQADYDKWRDVSSSVSWLSPDIFRTSGETKEMTLEITTDYIPDVGTSDLTISFTKATLDEAYNDPQAYVPSHFEWEIRDIRVRLISSNNIFSRTAWVEHIATNSNNNTRSKEYEINFADYVNTSQRNVLEVLTSTGWIKSQTWNYKGTNYSINELTVFVMASMQKLPMKVRSGGFAKTDCENYSLLNYQSGNWMPLSWTKNSERNEVDGEFVQLYQDRTNISLSEETVELAITDPDKTAVGQTMPPTVGFANGLTSIQTTQHIAAGAVTSIDIIAATYDTFKDGDIIRIVDMNTGINESLEVTADLLATNTSLSVSGTLTYDYYAGSFIYLDPEYSAAKTPRENSTEYGNWDNVTAAFVDLTTPTSGDSITPPDSDTLTAVQINKRLSVWRNGVKQRYRGDYSGAFTDYGYKLDDDNSRIYFYPSLEAEDVEIQNIVI